MYDHPQGRVHTLFRKMEGNVSPHHSLGFRLLNQFLEREPVLKSPCKTLKVGVCWGGGGDDVCFSFNCPIKVALACLFLTV